MQRLVDSREDQTTTIIKKRDKLSFSSVIIEDIKRMCTYPESTGTHIIPTYKCPRAEGFEPTPQKLFFFCIF